ncbi:MAG: hypothetical protein ACJLS3_15805 [Erythrobacter sp.]
MTDSGYASLGPTLLARKGGAKPAMRPQLPALGEAEEVAAIADEQLEDLGWNDMGDEADDTASAVVVSFDPATPFDAEAIVASPAHSPIVHRQQRRLEERLLADAVMTGPADAEPDYAQEADEAWDEEEDALEAAYPSLHSDEPDYAPELQMPATPVLAVRTKPAPQQTQRVSAVPAGRRAAFTLRLDPERHLKLRLAATMRGVSAQVLVTDALDAMLAEFEELNTIAARLQRH